MFQTPLPTSRIKILVEKYLICSLCIISGWYKSSSVDDLNCLNNDNNPDQNFGTPLIFIYSHQQTCQCALEQDTDFLLALIVSCSK